MKNLWNSFLGSLDNNKSSGFSARKLSAFTGVLTAIFITIKKLAPEYQLEALYAWLIFSLACLGIVTAEQVIKFKNGDKPKDSE